MNEAYQSFIGLICIVIILAIIAVVISNNSSTAGLIQSFSSALDSLLSRATQKAT
jgi:preprotein translocase subunit SecG